MKYSQKYKFIASFCLGFVLIISVMFAFLVGPQSVVYEVSETEKKVNYAYMVIKGLATIYLLVAAGLIWKEGATFAKYFPLTITAVLFQFVPALARVGFKDNQTVGTWVYFLVVVILFFFVGASLLYLVSNDQFKEEEQKAKHSSNYYRSTSAKK